MIAREGKEPVSKSPRGPTRRKAPKVNALFKSRAAQLAAEICSEKRARESERRRIGRFEQTRRRKSQNAITLEGGEAKENGDVEWNVTMEVRNKIKLD